MDSCIYLCHMHYLFTKQVIEYICYFKLLELHQNLYFVLGHSDKCFICLGKINFFNQHVFVNRCQWLFYSRPNYKFPYFNFPQFNSISQQEMTWVVFILCLKNKTLALRIKEVYSPVLTEGAKNVNSAQHGRTEKC